MESVDSGEPLRIRNVEDLLDRLRNASRDCDRVSIELLFNTIGRSSFGPLLLLAGLTALSPLSSIPSVPTTFSIVVFLLAGQLLLGRSRFWLPKILLQRSVPSTHFERLTDAVRPAARFMDRWLKPRMKFVTEGLAVYLIAVLCLLVAALSPFLEIVPLAASGVGAGVTAFGLALTFHDGALAVLAFGFSAVTAILLLGILL